MMSIGEWLAKRLVAWHTPCLVLAALVWIAAFPLARQIDLDWHVESMFPPGDPLVTSYQQLQERFGGKDICLAVYRDPELWSPDGEGLDRLAAINARLQQVSGVQSTLCLSDVQGLLERFQSPLAALSFGNANRPPALLDQDNRLAQAMLQAMDGYTHRSTSEYVAIACLLRAPPEAQRNQRGPSSHTQTLDELTIRLADLPAPASDGFVTGEPVLVSEGFQLVQRDGIRLGTVSSILVSAILLICFRSIRWTLIPLIVVHWSLAATQALLVLLDLQLTMISSTLTSLLTVIGVATSMHLLLRFQEGRRQGLERSAAIERAIAQLIHPIFWALLTDAIGFLALLAASVGPVRDFGIMMAIASMMVLCAIVLLVPGLALLGRLDTDPRTPRIDFAIRFYLRSLLDRILSKRTPLLVLGSLLFVISLLGASRMQVETDFTKNFRADSPLVQGYSIIEDELGGAGVWDVMLPCPSEFNGDYLAQVIAFEERLRAISVAADATSIKLTKVLSVADILNSTSQSPLLAALPVAARLEAMTIAMPGFTNALLTGRPNSNSNEGTEGQGNDGKVRWIRIMLRSKDQAPAAAKAALIAAVEEEVQLLKQDPAWSSLFTSEPPSGQVAGYHVMLGRLVSNVLRDQWKCLLLAALGMLVAIALATRSVIYAVAAVITNVLPVLVVLGALGWSGTKANMGVAMIAAVSLGLSVDSSIHYLVHFRRRVSSGTKRLKALRSAQETVGLAVVLSTMALVTGFLSLCTSEFAPTVVFGTLASLTLFGALLGNLIVLPLLIGQRMESKGANG